MGDQMEVVATHVREDVNVDAFPIFSQGRLTPMRDTGRYTKHGAWHTVDDLISHMKFDPPLDDHEQLLIVVAMGFGLQLRCEHVVRQHHVVTFEATLRDAFAWNEFRHIHPVVEQGHFFLLISVDDDLEVRDDFFRVLRGLIDQVGQFSWG